MDNFYSTYADNEEEWGYSKQDFFPVLPYYPDQINLSELFLFPKKFDKAIMYVDLRSVLQGIYVKDYVLQTALHSTTLETSIFVATMQFLEFHKKWADINKINLDIVIFFDHGRSQYHEQINSTYKENRGGNTFGLDELSTQRFLHTITKNFGLIKSVCDKVPHVYVVRLTHCESDFIPYYLMTRNLVNTSEDVVHITYSSDKDMYQNLTINPNSVIFQKYWKNKRILRRGQAVSNFLKTNKIVIDESWFPLILSVLGDGPDNVFGVGKIGPVRFCEIFTELSSFFNNDPQLLIEKIDRNEQLFDSKLYENTKNKYIRSIIECEKEKKLISKNMKLVSFELLSRAFDKPKSTEILDLRRSIEETFTKKKIAERKSISMALKKLGLNVERQLNQLYHVEQKQEL